MKVEQFVMAYQAEQDRLRALLPEGYTSLRPVLRINVEIREEERVAVEFNTPVAAFGKRGWLNIAHWESPADPITWEKRGGEVTFQSPFLRITYSRTGIEGGCPAERDNDGCFFPGNPTTFVPAESIDQNKEFCDCAFQWRFSPADAHGVSLGGASVAAAPTPPQKQYPRQPLTAQTAAAIPCQQILGAYAVCFEREETHKTHRI
ncbi:MAG: hypothetical protein ACI3VS_06885 [Evtepia sp.]